MPRRLRIKFPAQRFLRLTADRGSFSITGKAADLNYVNTQAPPVWTTIPGVTFTEGTASNFDLSPYVSDADSTELALTSVGTALPSGVTLNSSARRLEYDGVGAVSSTTGHKVRADDSVTAPITTFSLTSASTKTAAPFTIGHGFKQGDVPTGIYLSVTGTNIVGASAVVKNRWPDSSVKFAIISGRANLTAGVASSFTINRTTNDPGGTNLALSALQALILDNQNTVSLGGYGTVDLYDAISATSAYTAGNVGNKKWSAGLAQQFIASPEMSEWHFYTPAPSDDHLAVFWLVRLYANNAVEVDVVVENGWLNVANPNVKTYTPVVTIGGVERTAIGEITQYHHTRWSRAYWLDSTMPEVVPAHNAAYLRSTKLVPNYGWTSPTDEAWANNPAANSWGEVLNEQNPAPFVRGGFSADSGDYGYTEDIGILPRWDALYCTSADARAYRSTIGQARSYGRYSLFYRDETTLRPILYATYPTLGIDANTSSFKQQASCTTQTPANAGGDVYGGFAFTHHPSSGYLAYLISGRYHFMEQLLHTMACAYMNVADSSSDSGRRGATGIFPTRWEEVRGTAWKLRTLAQAIAAAPDDDALRSQYVTQYESNMQYIWARHNTGGYWANSLGILEMRSAEGTGSENLIDGTSLFQHHFFAQSLGHGRDLFGTASESHANLHSFASKAIVDRLTPTRYCYFGQYKLQLTATSPTEIAAEFPATWEEVYVYNDSLAPGGFDTLPSLGGPGGYFPTGFQMSYWGNAWPALVYAVDYGVTGAAAAYGRVTAAPNWENAPGINAYARTHNWHNNPLFGIAPRV